MKKRCFHSLAFVVWGSSMIALSSSATAQQQAPLPNPVANPASPWPFADFIVNSPAGTGWFSILRDTSSVQFFRQLDSSTHTFVIAAASFVLPPDVTSAEQLAASMKAALPANVEKRNALIASSEKVVTFNQLSCVRYSRTYEDSGALMFRKLTNIVTGLTCFHPTTASGGIDLSYSERGGEAQHADEVRTVGEAFMNSLRFSFKAASDAEMKMHRVMSKRPDASLIQEEFDSVKAEADAGDRGVANSVGQYFLLRDDGKRDFELGRKYLEIAAADGHVGALFNLGWIHEGGRGVPPDMTIAAKWYTLAADQRDADAQYALARLYAKGEGVPRDIKRAKNWERMSANNGNKRARANP